MKNLISIFIVKIVALAKNDDSQKDLDYLLKNMKK